MCSICLCVPKKQKMEEKSIIPFEGKEIRKIWHNDEWYFSVVDVIEILTDSKNPNRYWTDVKRRSEKESGQSYAFCVPLKLKGSDGKNYKTDCANTEGGAADCDVRAFAKSRAAEVVDGTGEQRTD